MQILFWEFSVVYCFLIDVSYRLRVCKILQTWRGISPKYNIMLFHNTPFYCNGFLHTILLNNVKNLLTMTLAAKKLLVIGTFSFLNSGGWAIACGAP